jgi:NADPH:quinone reductase-like Zn-dependent oxidoreductase
MRAIVCTRYGAPDVLQLKDVPKPTPKANEVLIRVRAAVVGPSDCAFRKGEPFIVRLIYGLNRPRLATQGVEFAGEVEAVGAAVTHFRPGDAVMGMSVDRFGAHGEYLCLPETKPLVHKPAHLSFEESVSIIDGPTTALIFLRDKARVQPGQRVLVNGASGAVGAAAVQLARHLGAEVTGVASTPNQAMVKGLGAHHVIDYTREDFARSGQTYDVIFDAVGKRSFGQVRQALTARGAYLTTVPTPGIVIDMLRTALRSGQKARFAAAGLEASSAELEDLRVLAEGGHLRPVIDRCYRLDGVAEAHAYVDTGRKRGSIVIVVNG